MFKRGMDEESLNVLRDEIESLEKFESLCNSVHGKFLIDILDKAILETIDEEDKKNIYEMDMNARDIYFVSVRSKRQTMKALKDKLVNAKKEKEWRVNEIIKTTKPK